MFLLLFKNCDNNGGDLLLIVNYPALKTENNFILTEIETIFSTKKHNLITHKLPKGKKSAFVNGTIELNVIDFTFHFIHFEQ